VTGTHDTATRHCGLTLLFHSNLNRIDLSTWGLSALPSLVSLAEYQKIRTILIIAAFHGVSGCQASRVRVAFSRSQIELVSITASSASHCSRAPAAQSADV
jgi:hypothetical protein